MIIKSLNKPQRKIKNLSSSVFPQKFDPQCEKEKICQLKKYVFAYTIKKNLRSINLSMFFSVLRRLS